MKIKFDSTVIVGALIILFLLGILFDIEKGMLIIYKAIFE